MSAQNLPNTNEWFRVDDCPFNRAHFATLIGRVYPVAPSYAIVRPVFYPKPRRA